MANKVDRLHDMGRLPWLVLLGAAGLALPISAVGIWIAYTLLGRFGPVELVAPHSPALDLLAMVFYVASLFGLLALAIRVIHVRRLPGT